MDSDSMFQLAERTIIAMFAAGISAASTDAAAIATSVTPIAEAFLRSVVDVTRGTRRRHAAEALADAAKAAGATTVHDFAAFVEGALSDEASQELLLRALSIAQDSSLRAKRRAAGRSVAAAVTEKGTRVNEEMLFLRALDDLDEPHFRLLGLMATGSPHPGIPDQPRAVVISGWTATRIVAEDCGLADTINTLLAGLQRHNLIQGPSTAGITLADKNGELPYNITDYGRRLLDRLAEPSDDEFLATDVVEDSG